MDKIVNVKSEGQQGGITVGEMNFKELKKEENISTKKINWKKIMINIFVGVVTALLVAIISYFLLPNKNNKINNEQNNMGDTFNVSSNNQQGGIIAGQVNIGNNQRHLNNIDEQSLKQSLSNYKKETIFIISNNNMESYQYAIEVKSFLENIGFIVQGVSQVMLAGGPTGISVQIEENNPVQVYVN